MTDPREARITALENEVNDLCRRHGEANRYPVSNSDCPAEHVATQTASIALMRQLAEDALRASEAFNRSIIESTVDCIKVLDLEGNLLGMPNGQRVLGIDCIPFLNTSWFDFWKDGDTQAAQAAVKAAAAGKTQRFVGRFRTQQNEARWWDLAVSPILDASGKPERLLVVSRDITERKQAEDVLRQRSAQFKTLIDEAPVGIYLIDADFRLQHVNRKALPVFGEIPNLIGRDLAEVFHIVWPSARANEAIGQFRQTMETGESFHVDELTETRADRQQVEYYEWHISRIELPNGSYGVVCYFRDISERVLAQLKIRESEWRLRYAADSAGLTYVEVDFASGQVSTPENFASVMGYTPPQKEGDGALGKQALLDRVHSEDRPRVDAALQEFFGGQPDGTLDYRVFGDDQRERWIETKWSASTAVQGKPLKSFATNLDMTGHKRAEQALRESQNRYRTLFNSIDEGFCVIEMLFDEAGKPDDYCFLEVNPSFEKQTGLHGATGRRIREMVPDLEASWFEIYGGVALTGEPIRFENKATNLDNRWFDVYAFRIGAADSRKVALLFTNITERKLAEQQLLALAKTLADQDRRKDEFLAMLSHELRNPLAPISNALQLLRLQKDESPEQRQARKIIERQSRQLNRLVDDLLEVSRLSTGRIQLRREHITLGGIVERAVESVQPLITLRRHQLTVSLPPEPLWLRADASRLEQVVVNLLTNAAKYTNEGGRIDFCVHREGDIAVLRLSDTGIGIADDLLPHIFELFTQAERSLDRSEGGLGIGLCLVQRLVELHGGTVAAQSVLGQGSEFAVRLPLAKATLPPTSPPPTEPQQPSEKPCRILVVDDNVDAAETLQMVLEASGHEARTTHEGLSALAVALAWRPDVMLLDIGLPGVNGYEVARRIRLDDRLKGVVLIALTGYGQEADRQLSLRVGFDHHLVKPANFRMLEEILASVAAARA